MYENLIISDCTSISTWILLLWLARPQTAVVISLCA